jgi:hypothetical protein
LQFAIGECGSALNAGDIGDGGPKGTPKGEATGRVIALDAHNSFLGDQACQRQALLVR